MILNIRLEKKIWIDLYRLQDDNPEHLKTAYLDNNIYSMTADEIHEQNIECIEYLKSTDLTYEEIVKRCPLIDYYSKNVEMADIDARIILARLGDF